MRSIGCTSATSNNSVAVETQPQSRVQQCCKRREGIVMWGVVERRSPATPEQQQCSVSLARQPNSARMHIAVSERGDAPPPRTPPSEPSSLCVAKCPTSARFARRPNSARMRIAVSVGGRRTPPPEPPPPSRRQCAFEGGRQCALESPTTVCVRNIL